MPGDPAIFDETPKVPILTTADLLNAFTIKFPPPDNIETWLVQAKSQFCLKGVVTSLTKFDHVVQSMSQNDAVKALDLICAHPHDDPYGHLKNRLLRMHGLTDYACYEAITSLLFSGDMLSSVLMSKMLSPLPFRHEACFFLCGAFLKRLLADVPSHLDHDRTLDPLSMALHADDIYQSPEDCPVLVIQAPSVSCGLSQCSRSPGPHPRGPTTPSFHLPPFLFP